MEFPTDDQNPYAPPDLVEGSAGESVLVDVGLFRQQKLKRLAYMLILFTALGFFGVLIEDRPVAARVFELAGSLCFVILVLSWCSIDREERGLTAWPFFALMMILCPGPLILMPIYFCATRGVRGLWSCLIAGAFMFTLFVAAGLGAFVAFWVIDFV